SQVPSAPTEDPYGAKKRKGMKASKERPAKKQKPQDEPKKEAVKEVVKSEINLSAEWLKIECSEGRSLNQNFLHVDLTEKPESDDEPLFRALRNSTRCKFPVSK
ncbi:hypothetical protein A2U01_0051637, partial [Trifolium medium]|nr:hypothetical protein [Trifolium medium]